MAAAPNHRDQNRELIARYQAGDAAAGEELLKANAGLVGKIASKHARFIHGLEFDDLFIEGQLGLLRAARSYDPAVAPAFSTYATIWIRQAINRVIEREDRLIAIPSHMLPRAAELPTCDLGLDAPATEDGEPMVDLLPATDDTEAQALARIELEETLTRLAGLTERERTVLLARCQGATLVEVGRRIGMSREGARHAEKRARRKVAEAR